MLQPFLPGLAITPLPQPTTRMDRSSSALPANLDHIQLAGERRLVTVILTDVTSSTNLLEQLGTEAWVELMNRVLHLLETEVYRFGGKVDQFRGDGLVAFFGAEEAHEDDPERAILAGLAMQSSLKPFADDLAKREEIDLRLRVGINTGEVIVANVGDSRQYHEDTAMGMGVAIASRMETAAEPGTVLVSENTYQLVASQFEWQSMGEITIKGISSPISGYRPLAPKVDIDRLQRLETFGISVPLIGREIEFETLKNCIEDFTEGRGSIVMLTGEAGVGKTFLVRELRDYFTRQDALLAKTLDKNGPLAAPFTSIQSRCRYYERSLPYSVLLDLLRNWLGVHRGTPVEEIRNRLRTQSEDLWGDQMGEYYPYLASFLSLPLEEHYLKKVKHLNAEGLYQQFCRVIRSWVQSVARRAPLLLTITEMQWADTSSLDLLTSCLLSLVDSEALMWLLVYRPDRSSPVWEFRYHVETNYPHRLKMLELAPLNPELSGELIDTLIGHDTVPDETRNLIIKNADGNPYYILELIHSLIDGGILAKDLGTGKWVTTSATKILEIPNSLQRLLLARIDRLSQGDRHILQLASVIGSTFWSDVLQVLVDENVPLLNHLTALQRAQLIQERGRVPELGMEYSFKSTLTRDAAYEGLLVSQRISYHMKVAEFFEEFVGLDNRKQFESLIAFHYNRAGNPHKELFYTLRAAEQARQVYANAESIDLYTRALELLEVMEDGTTDNNQRYAILTQRFEVLTLRGSLYYLTGNIKAGGTDAHALLPLANQMEDDKAWMVDALLKQPSVNHIETRDDITKGLPLAQEALSLAQQLGDKHREMLCLMAIGNLYSLMRDSRWKETAERALGLARELENQQEEVNLLLRIGNAYGVDDLERSTGYLEAATPIIEKLDDKNTELILLQALGAQYERSGDYYRLLIEYRQKELQITREIGDRINEGFALNECGQIQGLFLGDYEAGLVLSKEALHITENLTARIYPFLRVIQFQVQMGDFEEALESLEFARPISEREVVDIGRAGIILVSAILYNALGGDFYLSTVLELSSQLVKMVDDQLVSQQYRIGALCEATVAHLGLASLASEESERQIHLQQALESSRAAVDLYQHFGFVQIIECASEEVLFRHSLALAANGYMDESKQYLQRAYDEMMRKYELIPSNSHYRKTFLENIKIHREIRSKYSPDPSNKSQKRTSANKKKH